MAPGCTHESLSKKARQGRSCPARQRVLEILEARKAHGELGVDDRIDDERCAFGDP
jgi:hypothetical protein